MTTTTHLTVPLGVQVIIERPADGHILLMLRQNTGFFDGLYSLPGGHLEAGEAIAHTAARELAEELGLTLPPTIYRHIGTAHRLSDTHRIDCFLHLPLPPGAAPHNAEPHKCGGLLWCNPRALPENTVPYIRQALAHHLARPQGGWFFETGFPNEHPSAHENV